MTKIRPKNAIVNKVRRFNLAEPPARAGQKDPKASYKIVAEYKEFSYSLALVRIGSFDFYIGIDGDITLRLCEPEEETADQVAQAIASKAEKAGEAQWLVFRVCEGEYAVGGSHTEVCDGGPFLTVSVDRKVENSWDENWVVITEGVVYFIGSALSVKRPQSAEEFFDRGTYQLVPWDAYPSTAKRNLEEQYQQFLHRYFPPVRGDELDEVADQ